jgi:hypothetical protein
MSSDPINYSVDEGKRADFLIQMYETYNAEIARHFGLAWQAVSVFLASIIAIVAAIKQIGGIPAYVVISLYFLLVTWAVEVVIDAAFWYNRNLVVVANIERQFMKPSDARDIHWYFLAHRPFNKPITFMRSLLLFLVSIAFVVLIFYFTLPEINGQKDFFCSISSYIPLIIAAGLALVIRNFAIDKNKEYLTFLANAPGINRGAMDFRAPEHDLSYDPATKETGRFVSWLENAMLSALGVQMVDPAKAKPVPLWVRMAALALIAAVAVLIWYLCTHASQM